MGPGDGYMCDCPQDYTGTDCETRRIDILLKIALTIIMYKFYYTVLDLVLIDFVSVPCILCSCVYLHLYKAPGARTLIFVFVQPGDFYGLHSFN